MGEGEMMMDGTTGYVHVLGYCHKKDRYCPNCDINGFCQITACNDGVLFIQPSITTVGKSVMTNGDKIRQMTDKELAALFIQWETYGADYCVAECEYCNIEKQCPDCIHAWLQKEAE
jgi:hypothetical protein